VNEEALAHCGAGAPKTKKETKILMRNTSRRFFAHYRELVCPGTGIFFDTEISLEKKHN
jgi:hypothetical protein